MDITGATILITGGSSGIGYAVCRLLAEKKVKLYSFDYKEPTEPIESVQTIIVDVTNSDEIRDGLSQIGGPIDLLINNAGVMRRGDVLESSEEDFDLMMDVNMKGTWLVLKFAKQYLAPDATIVQMASRYALDLPTDPALYGLTRKFAYDLAEIIQETYPQYTVNILCPGPVDTPLARHGVEGEALEKKEKIMDTPEEIAEKIIALIESKKTKLIYDEEERKYIME